REHRMLRNIERLTRQRIEVATVPTVADLRARRLELTRASLREALLEDGLDQFRVVVESLAEEFDVMDVAAAAVKLADASEKIEDDEEIPAAMVRAERPSKGDRHGSRKTPGSQPGVRERSGYRGAAGAAKGRTQGRQGGAGGGGGASSNFEVS